MGVPDGNIRHLPGSDMSLDALRQAFADDQDLPIHFQQDAPGRQPTVRVDAGHPADLGRLGQDLARGVHQLQAGAQPAALAHVGQGADDLGHRPALAGRVDEGALLTIVIDQLDDAVTAESDPGGYRVAVAVVTSGFGSVDLMT